MSNQLKSGVFEGSAKGMDGIVTAQVTIEDNKITHVDLYLATESKNFGQAAKKELIDEIMSNQSADVDAVSGASVTSWAVKDAVKEALQKARGEEAKIDLTMKDGTFEGKGQGHGGLIKVSVTTKDNRITNVKILSQTESPNVGDYAMEYIPHQIVAQQTLGVDAVTGASVTSNGILSAVRNALTKAGADVSSWKKQPYEKSIPKAVDRQTDVVIAGAGLSGLATAVFSLQHGLKAILVEKNDQPGGSFRYAAGAFATTGSKALEEAHQTNNIDELIDWVKELNEHNSKRPIDLDLVRYLAKESGKTFDELLKIANAKPSFFLKLPYIAAGFAPGAKITEILQKYILAHGGEILNDTVITKINTKDGKATGIEAKNANGEFKIDAKNVVISTGGASYDNKKLLEEQTPSLQNVHLFNEANPGNTGDGYKLLRDVDGQFFDNDVYKNAELDFAPQMHTDYSNEPDYSKAIVVNNVGDRFTSEAPFSFLNLTTQLYREGSPRYYLIYDAKTMDPDFKKRVDQVPQGEKTYIKANSIDEIADKLNLKNLKQTFEKYQDACRTGKDEFGKVKENLVPFTGEDGYYALYVMPGSWGTIGGVKINHQMQVQRKDGSYFDNLFALGEMSTGALFSDFYMIGFSLADYSTQGRLVAENIAAKN